MNLIRTAVIVRAEDGVFQPMLLKPLASGNNASIYRLTGCVLRRTGSDGDGPAILSLTNLSEDVFVFVNIPLETANHMFLDALVDTVRRPQCGVASGVLIGEGRNILHSGFDIASDGEPQDAYAGQVLRPHTFKAVRAVSALAPHFFAVRRERFAFVGGLGILSSHRMMELLQRLSTAAQEAGEQLLVTPDAVATLTGELNH